LDWVWYSSSCLFVCWLIFVFHTRNTIISVTWFLNELPYTLNLLNMNSILKLLRSKKCCRCCCCLSCLHRACLSSIIRFNFQEPNTMRPISRAVLRPYVCPSCRHISAGRRRFSSKLDAPELYDVVCVGGGPAGLGLLAALRMHSSQCIQINN
jgi:hypothetical protein